MTDDAQQVQVIYGPYADQRLTLSKADAAAAISEGWAVDPFKEKKEGEKEEPPKELTEEERTKIIEKAEHAARHLRGEDDEHKAEPHKDMHAGHEHDGEYETREQHKPKRK